MSIYKLYIFEETLSRGVVDIRFGKTNHRRGAFSIYT